EAGAPLRAGSHRRRRPVLLLDARGAEPLRAFPLSPINTVGHSCLPKFFDANATELELAHFRLQADWSLRRALECLLDYLAVTFAERLGVGFDLDLADIHFFAVELGHRLAVLDQHFEQVLVRDRRAVHLAGDLGTGHGHV